MVLLLPPKSRAETPRRIPRPAGYLLIFCATAARHGVHDLGLFAGTGVLDKVPDEDDAIGTDVGALEAGVMRLYAVVSFTSGERVACRWYPQFVHSSVPFSVGRASRSSYPPAGPFLSNNLIIHFHDSLSIVLDKFS
jgi:hypothetical protein